VLHFGAVDHDTTVWVDGVEAMRHRGGFTPIRVPLGAVEPGQELEIVVRARDSRHELKAGGKQATWYGNTDCYYTRTTGIWQTVWVEAVDELHLRRFTAVPDADAGRFDCTLVPSRNRAGATATVTLSADGVVVAEETTGLGSTMSPSVRLDVPREHARSWSPNDPFLYTLE
jgi:beta-galactosidase/beta-glucuronidase